MRYAPIPEEDLGKIRESGVDINLLCTRRCNFECAHCMYAAGPKMPGRYIDWADLQLIEGFVIHLREVRDIENISVNLVGGEPTLNMEEFQRILRTVSTWRVKMEMTTNGWWLRDNNALRNFARIVGPFLCEEALKIRISDSQFHDAFRSEREKHILKGFNLLQALQSPYEYGLVANLCPECGGEIHNSEGLCPHCKTAFEEDELIEGPDIPYQTTLVNAVEVGDLHIDHQGNHPNKLSPVGRARNENFPAFQDGHCDPTENIKFTFMPGGDIYDVCCNGGKIALGNARDPENLLRGRYHFMKALHRSYPNHGDRFNSLQGERCRQCPIFAAKWLMGKTQESALAV